MDTTMDTSYLQWILQWIRPFSNGYYNGYVLSPMDTTIDTSCLQWILQWIRSVSNGYYNGYVLSPMDTSYQQWIRPVFGEVMRLSTGTLSVSSLIGSHHWGLHCVFLPHRILNGRVMCHVCTSASSSGDCCCPDCNTPHTGYACK
ncbi:hypothetical protein BgiMline_000083 [Biomphalaria glabrata]